MHNSFPFEHFIQKSTVEKVNNYNEISKDKHNIQTSTVENSDFKMLSNEIIEHFANKIGQERFQQFFSGNLIVTSLGFSQIELTVCSQFIKKLLESNYLEEIKASIKEILGKDLQININTNQSNNYTGPIEPVHKIQDETQENRFNSVKTVKDYSFRIEEDEKANYSEQEASHLRETKSRVHGFEIDTAKEFSHFVVGPSNNLAHASALAVASKPGQVYRSLYLHGSSGLGKTHLLHAIGNHILKNHPQMKIYFISASSFMSEMVKSLRTNQMDSFRKKYTDDIDILMIDDIHELKDRTGTQNEFFHVFNELSRKGKQLVFTSDKHPKEIDGIEERVKTRLSSALVIEIQQPDLETRIAILKSKCEQEDIYLPDDVVNLIAKSIKTNIRELEGSLIKLGAYSSILNIDIDVEIAREQLKIDTDTPVKEVTIDQIVNGINNYFKVSTLDLVSKSRNRDITYARHIAMYMCYKIKKATLVEIGKYFGDRDHTSVMHAVKKIQNLIRSNSTLSAQIYEIESQITQ